MDWWNQIHNWDGATPWTQYMKYSHAYLGPNAIPLPTLQRSDMGSYFKSSSQMSLIEDDSFLTLHNELHWDRGHTQIHITHQSIEYYRMSEEVRDLRISRDQDGEGVLAGDVLIDISTRLWTKHEQSLWFTFHTKTAAGPLPQARFTDAPGYAFFFSHQKSFDSWGNWEPYLTTDAGFQVYQTHWVDYPQNDGFLGNIKLQLHKDKTYLSAQLRTFTGYFLDGDWPRMLELQWGQTFTFGPAQLGRAHVGWTRGLNDYPFSFLTVGMTYWLDVHM
ncbi:MAG: hypothetical protein DWQ21_03960 [Bacteroidetes bacterium]|nr:MAG: hypothetical protein DWQ21_03960 [Bacteroidota bacterium]REK51775.1 MAG: hypothetical protein DWQ49_13995 [Bacteroidota bacterium]